MSQKIFISGVDNSTYPLIKDRKIPDNVILVPKKLLPIFTDESPLQIIYGSRFSGKSIAQAINELIHCDSDEYYRGIFIRQSNKAARNSQFQLFKDISDWYPYLGKRFEFHSTALKVVNKKTGHYIQGASFEDPSSLMSVPEITRVWVEEPISMDGSIQRKQFESIMGTMRNKYGLPPIFTMTFNPIGKNNFIYEDIFDPEKKKYDSSFVNIVKCNWYDNPFCPEASKIFLENLKRTNPSRYEVDGNGNFGEPTNDQPFLLNYKDEIHYTNKRFEFGHYETFLSFDFNHTPCTCTVYQKIPNVGIVAMREYQQNGGTDKLCELMKLDTELMSINRLLFTVTGDSNGKNNTSTSGDKHDYDRIQAHFGLMKSQIQGVYSTNAALVYSRRLCERFLDQVPFYIDVRCEKLRSDMLKAREDKHGNLFKNREQGYPMDLFDTFRYCVHLLCKNGEKDIIYLRNSLL